MQAIQDASIMVVEYVTLRDSRKMTYENTLERLQVEGG